MEHVAMADFVDLMDFVDYVTPFMDLVSSAYTSFSSFNTSPNTVREADPTSEISSNTIGQEP
eukprot:4104120-Amphidinium_carterae.1